MPRAVSFGRRASARAAPRATRPPSPRAAAQESRRDRSDRCKLLIDCYELIRGRGSSTGIYNYALHLVRALGPASFAAGLDVTVVCNERNAVEFSRRAAGVRIEVIDGGPTSKAAKVVWDLGGAARKLTRFAADVYFSPRGFVPIGIDQLFPATAITVHDMIPFYYSRYCRSFLRRLENDYITTRLLRSIERATLVITVSNASAQEIVRLSGRRERLEVIHNGVRRPTAGLAESRTHVFAMASALRHKNLEGVIRGYSHYVKSAGPSSLPLLVCGATTLECARWADDPRILNHIRCVKDISDRELDRLYATSAAFVFVPRIEGFGLPPLEALQAGASLVVSDIPALREVLHGCGQFVDPEDPAAIGRAIGAAVSSAAPRPRSTEVDLLLSYTWERSASRFVAAVTSFCCAPG
jgi:glycosyltransferase involved in cell wall biosynthesis